jgi:hypothetical protein
MDRSRPGMLRGQKFIERGVHRRRAGRQKLLQIKSLLRTSGGTYFRRRHAGAVVGKGVFPRKRIPNFSIDLTLAAATVLRSFLNCGKEIER